MRYFYFLVKECFMKHTDEVFIGGTNKEFKAKLWRELEYYVLRSSIGNYDEATEPTPIAIILGRIALEAHIFVSACVELHSKSCIEAYEYLLSLMYEHCKNEWFGESYRICDNQKAEKYIHKTFKAWEKRH
jgi:hypothetical protein